MIDDPLLTTRQAAEALRREEQTLAGWRTSGWGPSYEKHGGRVMYRRSEIEVFRASMTRTVQLPPVERPRRIKGMGLVDTPEKAQEARQVDVMSLSGRALRMDGLAVWEPVDLNTLTVAAMLAKYVDVVAVGEHAVPVEPQVPAPLRPSPEHSSRQLRHVMPPFREPKRA